MRLKTKIPAAGVEKSVKLTGRSLIVESAGVYSDAEQVPTFDFNPGAGNNPIYPRSVYVNNEGVFNSIILKGTAESADDEITLYSVDECLTTDLNVDVGSTTKVTLKATFKVAMTDTVKTLNAAQIANSNLDLPSTMFITATGAACRYAFNADPGQTVAGDLSHVLKEDETQEIKGAASIENFRFLSAVAAAGGEISFTMFYG